MKNYKKIYIEITNVCNLACDFCPQSKRKPEFMKIETFDKILAQIKPYTDYIYLHVKGEPLLHPEIDRILDLSYEKGLKVNITTNGTLINKAKDKLLTKQALRQINFSLHSIDGNKGFNGIDEYLNNIFSFIHDAISKTNIIIALRLWNLDKERLADIEGKKNQELLEAIEQEFNLEFKIEEKVIPGGGIKVSDRIYLNQDNKFQWPDLREIEDDGIGFCYGLRNQAAILVDGTVVPCCLDGEGVINLGNINNNDFSDIVNSERANTIFNGFSERKAVEELCRKCGYRKKPL